MKIKRKIAFFGREIQKWDNLLKISHFVVNIEVPHQHLFKLKTKFKKYHLEIFIKRKKPKPNLAFIWPFFIFRIWPFWNCLWPNLAFYIFLTWQPWGETQKREGYVPYRCSIWENWTKMTFMTSLHSFCWTN